MGSNPCAGRFFFVSSIQVCETPKEMHAGFVNLNFTGASDTAPAGWFIGPEWFMPPHVPVYEAQTVSSSSCNGSQQCATVHSLRDDPHVRFCFLYQVVDATQYRGKVMIYRADVRTKVTLGSAARLLVRIHRSDCSTSFRDDMGDHPITSAAWSPYEIHAPIALNARDIEFGMQVFGEGEAWIDNISVTFVDQSN